MGIVIGTIGLYGMNANAADLQLTSEVDSDCSVALDARSYTVDLTNGEADSTVATVTETCNDANGYIISFSSANGGVLENDQDASEQKAYTASYGTFSNQSLASAQSVTYNSYTAGNSLPLRINLDAHGASVLAAGVWSDTITVSIAAQ